MAQQPTVCQSVRVSPNTRTEQRHRHNLHVRGRKRRSDRRVLDEGHVGEECCPVAQQHAEHPRLPCHALEPRQVECDREGVVASQLEADLHEGIDRNQQQKAHEHGRSLHAPPPPTNNTPMAISEMASMRAPVICSPKKMRPPSMTRRMSTEATMTPCHSGTTDKNASHMKNSNT